MKIGQNLVKLSARVECPVFLTHGAVDQLHFAAISILRFIEINILARDGFVI